MVISVDTGNKMIKTEHYEFNSGIDVLDTIPGENDEVIEFGGKYYRTTNRRISYMEDKTEDDRYYILTLIAIAKELDTMKKEAVLAPNELIEIELLVGLPPAHYGKYRKKFQQYFQRDGKVVGFKYGGTSYQILIHEVKVYVQAYAAYCVLAARRHLTELPKVLVIDIGGFTVDYMILRYGRLEKEHVDSLESGVICLYGRIRAAIRQKYSIALDEEDIDNIILGKNTGYMQELKERVREVTIGYVTELLGTFRELGIDFRTTQTVFMGGGAILVSEIIKVVWERFKGEYFIINDPKMGKKDEYRFNLRFDETDETHRLVVKYLNSCGHNKAKYIVRAFLAYWKMSGKSLLSYVFPEIDAEQLLPEAKQENDKKTAVVAKASDAGNDNGTYIQKDHSEQQLLEKSLQEDHFVNLEGDCEADEAEVLLIKNNYKMFEDLE